MAGHVLGHSSSIPDDLMEARWAMLNTPGGLNVLYSRFPTEPGAQREPGRSAQEVVERLKETKIPIILFWGR